MKIYLGDGPFSNNVGRVNFHPSKETPWVVYINQNYFDSYGFSPPQKLSNFVIRRKGYCVKSEYKIQGLTSKKDPLCAANCVYKICLTKILRIDFKSAVLDLYYQTIQKR